MKREEVQQILQEVEKLLGDKQALPDPVEAAVDRLLNLVESLCKDIDGLKGDVDRLRKLLEEKKRNKPGGAEGTTPRRITHRKSIESQISRRLRCCEIIVLAKRFRSIGRHIALWIGLRCQPMQCVTPMRQ